MSVIGGDLRKITIQNPTVGTAVLYCVSGEASTFKLGGLENNDTGNVNGAGQLMRQMQMIPGYIEATVSNNMGAALPELEFVQLCCRSTDDCKITVEHVNGTAYGGAGVFVGETTLDGKAATFKIKMSSGLGFKKL